MNLGMRDALLTELMDDPDCDRVLLNRTLARFALVNRLVSGWGAVYRSHMRPALGGIQGTARILEIGCGGADVLRRVVRLARNDGFAVEGTGIDPDRRALTVAENAAPLGGVHYRHAYAGELVDEEARFDIVISNHVLHHLDVGEFDGVIADSAVLAERLCLHSDIERSRAAYAAYAVGITPLASGSFLRTDGLRSIRRSYTRAELAAALPSGWSVERPAPFRLLAVRRTAAHRTAVRK